MKTSNRTYEWESGWEAMTQRPFPEACAILFVNSWITSIPFNLAVFVTFFILPFILKHIENFKYLSSMISENGGSEEEVRHRVRAGCMGKERSYTYHGI